MTLERLIGDGRIHPAALRKRWKKVPPRAGAADEARSERAVMGWASTACTRTGQLIGRLKYRTSFGQNA